MSLLALAVWVLSADTVPVAGRVVDEAGVGIDGANVFVVETLDGAITDEDGGYTFVLAEQGTFTVVVKRVGYADLTTTLAVPGPAQVLTLEAEAIALPPILVEVSSFTGGSQGDVELTSLDVVTTPGTAADVFRAMQTFAGVGTANDGAGLIVRGGDVAETRVTLDGAAVLAPYRFESPTGDAFGAFDPFLLDGIFFSAGGFGAGNGDALSGLVELETMGRPASSSVDLTASLAALSGRVGVALPHGLGLRFAGTRSSTGLLFDLNGVDTEFTNVPEGWDLSAGAAWDYSATGSMKLFGMRQTDRFGVLVDSPSFDGAYDSENGTHLVVLSGREFRDGLELSYSLSSSGRSRTQEFGAFRLIEEDRFEQGRMDVGFELGAAWLARVGVEAERRTAGLAGSLPDAAYDVAPGARTTLFDSEVLGSRAAAFGEATWRSREWLHFRAGVRADHGSLPDAWTLDPRFSAGLALLDGATLSASWGLYHQIPPPLHYESTVGRPGLASMRAEHQVLGLQVGSGVRQARVELYRKEYRALSQLTRDQTVRDNGVGTTSGVDLFLMGEGPIGTRGRLALGLLRARRTDPDTGTLARSPFDISRNLVLVLERGWGARWQTGLTLKAATGTPFTAVASARYAEADSLWVPEYGAPFEERLPSYARLDLSVSVLANLGREELTVFFASISNVLGRENFTGWQYSPDYSERSPTGQGFARTLYFGATTTLSF